MGPLLPGAVRSTSCRCPTGSLSTSPAQRATHLVASIEHDLTDALTLRAEVYRKDYDDPFARHENLLNTLVVLPELKPDRILIAPEEALAEGAEVSLRYESGCILRAGSRYTHSRVLDRVDGEWLHRSWDQRDYASGGLSWRGERWEASLAAPGTAAGRPRTSSSRRSSRFRWSPWKAERGSNVSNYARFDFRVARRFDLGAAGELTAFLEVSNVTKRNNDCCVEYQLEDDDEEVDEVFLDVEPRGSLPLIPSLGVLWKF